jgi:hypothetical protein
MVIFLDGPAKGQVLSLSRATVFLRVVHDNKTWDALDQLDDTPKPDERIFAYQCSEYKGCAFIDGTGKDGRTGWRTAIASYQLVKDQPTDAEMRSTFGWQKWCEAEAERQGLKK